ncbi:MAG: alpha/beta hydrolase, partial [Myxococcales bacterium]|nr:alpha/beta hydrolase [Myxococcales bacterium]
MLRLTTFHPELERSQRVLPRGLGRPWLLGALRVLSRTGGALQRVGERVEHGRGTVFVHRPSAPRDAPGPALLWMHGGGLIMGDPRLDGPFLAHVAESFGAVVASAKYRLAPESPFPAGLDDCVAAFDWLASQPEVDPTRIAVGGQSAGGGLAAALCQRLRDRGGVQPAFQALVYPMLDDRSAWADPGPEDARHRVWDRRSNVLGWQSYLAGREPPAYAVPARAADLTGLPPAWIGVGTADLFHDEDVAYAERLRASGVPVDLEVVPGAYHGFDVVVPDAEVSRA